MEKNIIDYIQRYYTFEISENKKIYLRDIFEDNSEEHIFDITSKVKFIWGRAKQVTGVDLRNKEYTHIQKIIREIFRSNQSIDFYSFMVDEIRETETEKYSKGLAIPLKDLKHEFPFLYGDKVNNIISENTKKNE